MNPCINCLHAKKPTQNDTIPTNRAAQLEHIKRSAYQGGSVWGQVFTHEQHLLSTGYWGLVEETTDRLWIPNWQQLADIAAIGVIQMLM